MYNKNLKEDLIKISKENKNLDSYIAKIILKNYDAFSEMTIIDLAKLASSSTTSIVRFCSRMKLKGFKELKALIIANQTKFVSDNFNFEIEKSLLNDSTEFFNEYCKIKALAALELRRIFENGEVKQLSEKIRNAKRVFVYAFSLAYNIAKPWVIRQNWLENKIVVFNDYNLMFGSLNEITEGDLCIFITLSGNNEILRNLYNKIKLTEIPVDIKVITCNTQNDFPDVDCSVVNSFESLLWDCNSISAQTVMQFLDLVYYESVNFYAES